MQTSWLEDGEWVDVGVWKEEVFFFQVHPKPRDMIHMEKRILQSKSVLQWTMSWV
jgi:hypothetical protein